jgi:hypothetical protein
MGLVGHSLRAAGIDRPAPTPSTQTRSTKPELVVGERPQVLGDGCKNKLVLGGSRSTQSKPTEFQDTLQVCEPHLDLLALTS